MPRKKPRKKKLSSSTDSESNPEPKRCRKMAAQAEAVQSPPIDDRLTEILNTLAVFGKKIDKISSVEDRITELQKSVDFISGSFDTFKKELDDINAQAAQLKTENEHLQGRLQATQRELSTTQDEMHELQQYTRRNILEISGVPQHAGEDTDDIAIRVAEAVGVIVSASDIDNSHRLPRRHQENTTERKQPPPIIVKFTRRTVRNNIYYSRKNLKDKTPKHLNLDRQATNRIYINESLSSVMKRLFHQANERRKMLNWKFIWTNNGKIYTRKDADSQPIMIASSKAVNRIA
ncbi:uncharacterized protein LOC144445411 [Glandiceps talaboti]